MEAFEFADILAGQQASGDAYVQFINRGSMSLGLYVLPAGSEDTQTPHLEDEIYYVVSGRGDILVDGERRAVQAGSIVFVARQFDHRFVDITEDLAILVFFAPEHTRG
ncbi:MAG: cupin domain-containing protein [Thermomicrobiales bacterium]|nr:cupin domain-containing protein [Thermomicrobiales bacterium]